MRILVTGGSGDLGQEIALPLINDGHELINVDPKKLHQPGVQWVDASITDHDLLVDAMQGCEAVIHIAALHGIHEHRGLSTREDIQRVNVAGTFNVLEAAAQAGAKKVVFISSTSAEGRTFYGMTKRLCEEMCRYYVDQNNLEVVMLRPRGFIPPWSEFYDNYMDWAKWFWSGAVHLVDVAQATVKAVRLLDSKRISDCPTLTVDGSDPFDSDRDNWDHDGPGTSFKQHFGAEQLELMNTYQLDVTQPPSRYPTEKRQLTQALLGYQPTYGIDSFLDDLSRHHRGEAISRPSL